MSDSVLVALIASVPPTLMGASSLIASLKNARKLEVIHEATNGLTAKLVRSEKQVSFTEGVESEKEKH